MKKLDVKRNILCFKVSTTEIYYFIEPIVLNMIGFLKASILKAIQQITLINSQLMTSYIQQLQTVPDQLLALQKDYIFPNMMETKDSILDFSCLVGEHGEQSEYVYKTYRKLTDLQAEVDRFNSEKIAFNRTIEIMDSINANSYESQAQKSVRTSTLNKSSERKQTNKLKSKTIVVEPMSSNQSRTLSRNDSFDLHLTNDSLSLENDFKEEKPKEVQQLVLDMEETSRITVYNNNASTKLLQNLLNEQVDNKKLKDVETTINTFGLSKAQYTMFKNFEIKTNNLCELAHSMELMNEQLAINSGKGIDNIINQLQCNQFDYKESITKCKQLKIELERQITTFTAKKQNLYLYFQKNLLCLYLQYMKQIQNIAKQVFITHNDIIFSNQNHINQVYIDEQLVTCFEQQKVDGPQQLYLFMLFQNQLGPDYINNQIEQINEIIFELDIIKINLKEFNDSLILFDTQDFFVNEFFDKKQTEADNICQFIRFIILKKLDIWSDIQDLQKLVQNELSSPIALLNIQNVMNQLGKFQEQFSQNKLCFIEVQNKLIEYLDLIIYNEESNQATGIPEPVVINEKSITSSFISFPVLKYIYFTYKTCIKELQLQQIQNDEIINQKYIDQLLNNIKQRISKVQFDDDLNLKFKSQISVTTDNSFNQKFKVLTNEAVQILVSPPAILDNLLLLLQNLREQLPNIQHLQTIALQPRHFISIAKHLVSPDFNFEINNWNTLIQVPISSKTLNISEILFEDRDNAYRNLLGSRGDGILELLNYSLVINFRRDEINQISNPGSVINFKNPKIFLQQCENLQYGFDVDQYKRVLEQKIEQEETLFQQDIQYLESETEQLADQDSIEQKSQLQTNQLSTINSHVNSVFMRLLELNNRRILKGQKVPSQAQNKVKEKFSLELDRFTTSISRLIYRGIFNENKKFEIFRIISQAVQEYSMLEQLANIQKKVYKLRLPLQKYYFEDNYQVYVLGDISELLSKTTDQLIHMQSLKTQCSRLKDANISLAVQQLNILDNLCLTSQSTVLELNRLLTQYIYLYQSFGLQTQVSKSLQEETRLFQRISRIITEEMQNIQLQNGEYLQCCNTELLKKITHQLQPDIDKVQKALDVFISQKRQSFSRFCFISDTLLCKYLSVQIIEQFMQMSNQTINQVNQQIFDNVGQINIDFASDQDVKKIVLNSVQSREGEYLMLKQINIKQPIEIWTQALSQYMIQSLKDQTQKLYQSSLVSFYDMIKIDGIQFRESYVKQYQQQYNTQVLQITKQAVIFYFLLNYEMFDNRQYMLGLQKGINYTASNDSISLDALINLLIDFQTNCINFYVSQVKNLNPDKMQLQKLQALIQNESYILDILQCIKEQKLTLHDQYLIYQFSDQDQVIYLTSLHSEFYKIQNTVKLQQSKLSSYLSINTHKNYRYEFLGSQQRLIPTFELISTLYQINSSPIPTLLEGNSGIGKTSTAIEYNKTVGQLYCKISCKQSSDISFIKKTIIGALTEGCCVIFDDLIDLQMETMSLLCTYMQLISQSIQQHLQNVYIDGEFYNLNTNFQLLATAQSLELKYQMISQYRVISIIKPKISKIFKNFFKQLGFFWSNLLSNRISQFFKYIQSCYITELKPLDVTYRKMKALYHLIDSQWKSWVNKLLKHEKIAQLLKLGPGQKILKEQQQFSYYLEQFCVCHSIYRLFYPAIISYSQLQLFHNLMLSIFDQECLQLIIKQQSMVQDNIIHNSSTNFEKLEMEFIQLLSTQQYLIPYNKLFIEKQNLNSIEKNEIDIKQLKELNPRIDINVLQAHQAELILQETMNKQQQSIQEQYKKQTISNDMIVVNEQVEKFQQLEESLWIRNGVIILGQYSGKTALWKNSIDSSNMYKIISPGFMSVKELFGTYSDGYFVEGIIPQTIRQFKQVPLTTFESVSTSGLKYIVFDGPIDKQTAEFMNPVLDDTKMLELPNGDQLQINNYLRFIFETENLQALTPTFISRCAVIFVNEIPDLWKACVIQNLRLLFQQDYQEWTNNFKIDPDSKQIIRIAGEETKQITLKLETYYKLSKRTKEQVIHDKISALMHNYYKYNANYYILVLKLFNDIMVYVNKVIKTNNLSINRLFLVTNVLYMFKQLSVSVKENNKQLAVHHYRSYLIFSFVQMFKQMGYSYFKNVISEFSQQEYHKLFEIYGQDVLQNLEYCYYDAKLLIPVRFVDTIKYCGDIALLNKSIGSILELDVLHCEFVPYFQQYIVQTSQTRYNDLNMLKIIKNRSIQSISIGKQALLHLNIFSKQNNIYILTIPAFSSTKDFVDIIKQTYSIEGNQFIPKYNNQVFLFPNFDKSSEQLQKLVQFIIKWKRIFVVINNTIKEFEINDFVFIIQSDYVNTQVMLCQKYDIEYFNQFSTAVISNWSNMPDINPTITPVFGCILQLINNYILQVYKQFNILEVEYAIQMVVVISMLNKNTFSLYITDPSDANYIVPFKRYLFLSVLYIIRQEYINKVSNGNQQALEELLQILCQMYLASQIVELKPNTDTKLKLHLHKNILFKHDICCLTTIVSPINHIVQLSTNYINGQYQQEALLVPHYQITYLEPEFQQVYNEIVQYNMNQVFPLYTPAFCHSRLQQVNDSSMQEISERVQYVSYLFASKKHIVCESAQMDLSLKIYSTVCRQLGIKYIIMQSVGQLLDQLFKTLKQILYKLLSNYQDNTQIEEYCIAILPEYIENVECQKIISQILQGSTNIPALLDDETIRRTQLVFKDQVSLLHVQCFIFNLLNQQIRLLLLANKSEFNKIQIQYKYDIEFEMQKQWSSQSVAKYIFISSFTDKSQQFTVDLQANMDLVLNSYQFLSKYNNESNKQITPIQFQKFCEHFMLVYSKVKTYIIRQQQQLLKALDTFEQAQKTSLMITEQINIKQPVMIAKQKTIQQLLEIQSAQKFESEQLQTQVNNEKRQLSQTLAIIQQEKAFVEAELKDIEPIMKEATLALQSMSRNDAAEIAMINNPSRQIQAVCGAICLILQENPSWASCRLVLGKGDFVYRLLNLDPRDIPDKVINQFGQLVQQEFDLDILFGQSKAVGTLGTWGIAFKKYIEIVNKVEPRVIRVKELQTQYDINKKLAYEKEQQLQQINKQIEQLTNQLQDNYNQASLLEIEIAELEQQLKNIEQIQKLLQQQKIQWQQQLSDINIQSNQAVMYSIFMVVYNILQVNSKPIVETVNKLVKHLKLELGSFDLQSLIDFVSEREHMLSLTKYSQTNDEFTLLTILNLDLLQNSVVILDRDKQFETYVNNICLNKQKVITIVYDINFKEQLLRAVNDNAFLVVYCQICNISVQLQQLQAQLPFNLSDLITQTSNIKKEVVFEDIKFMVNGKFQMIIVDQQTKCLQIDQTSSFNVVSFLVHSQTIEQLLLSVIVQQLSDGIQVEYQELVATKTQFNVDFAKIENNIIHLLSRLDIKNKHQQCDLIKELQTLTSKQQEINSNIQKMYITQQKIDEQKSKYIIDSKLLAVLYNNLNVVGSYPLNLYLYYIKMFIENGVHVVSQYILKSVSQIDEMQLKLRYLFSLDEKDQLIKSCIQIIQSNDEVCSVTDENTMSIGIIQFNKNESDASIPLQDITDIFCGFKEKVQPDQLLERRLMIGKLLFGLFKVKGADYRNPLTDDNKFKKFAQDLISVPIVVQDIDYELQTAICQSVIMEWQKIVLQLFKQSSPQLIKQLVQRVNKQYNNKLSDLQIQYLYLVFVKHFDKSTLQSELNQFISENIFRTQLFEQKNCSPYNLLKLSKQMQLICKYSDAFETILAFQQQLEKPIQIVNYYKGITLTTPCILVVQQQVNTKDLTTIIELNAEYTIFVSDTNETLHSFPKYYLNEILDFKDQSRTLVTRMSQELRLILGDTYQFNDNQIVQLFQSLRLDAAKNIEMTEMKQALLTLKEQLIMYEITETPLDYYHITNFLKFLLKDKISRQDFKELISITLQGQQTPIKQIQSHSFANTLDKKYLIPQIEPLTPIHAFLLEEIAFANLISQGEFKSTHNDINKAVQYITELVYNSNIKQIDVQMILRPKNLFQTLLLQAVHYYGGKINEYNLVFGLDTNQNDLQLINLDIMNAQPGVLFTYAPKKYSTFSLKVAASREYKRRNIILPLGNIFFEDTVQMIQSKVQQSPKDKHEIIRPITPKMLKETIKQTEENVLCTSHKTNDKLLTQYMLKQQQYSCFKEKLQNIQIVRNGESQWIIQVSSESNLNLQGAWIEI
ncbi:Dynein_heavy chain [Hexamita inflata]|uniref:Dynein heavy chain n=1 Tax=Hexamita inflata TaxID=28002 RepID=A0AA86TTL2_9EUKA|nr:Dynein heavy chain [Hexamita inflata]